MTKINILVVHTKLAFNLVYRLKGTFSLFTPIFLGYKQDYKTIEVIKLEFEGEK